MNFKEFLEKLRGMSDLKKKIVLWTIVVIAAVIMGYFWVRKTADNFQKINQNISQIKIPDILQTTTPTN